MNTINIVLVLLIFFFGVSLSACERDTLEIKPVIDEPIKDDSIKNDEDVSAYFPDGIYVRIITLALHANGGYSDTAKWMLNNWTAQDILKMIKELKPDCLERFVTGFQDPNKLVPVAKGEPPMTVLEFLNAAVRAGSEKCIIIPKLNLNWGDKYFFAAAENLYNLPLEKPMRNINLDNWDRFCKEHTEEEVKSRLRRLKEIGYKIIGTNMTGGYHEAFGYMDYMDFNINKIGWVPNEGPLNKLKNDPDLKKYYLYIDYPEPMNTFLSTNTPDQQADIYTYNIEPKQKELDFTFVYAILQDDFDATQLFTSTDGPYGGKSIYAVMKDCIQKTRQSSK